MTVRHYSWFDKIIIEIDACLSTLLVSRDSDQSLNPGGDLEEPVLTVQERKHSASLMRVNHTGEVCAQALYRGQMLRAVSSKTHGMLERAREQEIDHLAWCDNRLKSLNSHRSYFNIFWYWGSFIIGLITASASDSISLGFVYETEKQVGKHLEKHMYALPANDTKSRAIVEKMKQDEVKHGQSAANAGAFELPCFVKKIMSLQSRLMTTIAYWV